MKKFTSAILAIGITASTAAIASPSGQVNFYTSMQLNVVEPIVESFNAVYPDVKVDLLYSGSVELEQRIFSEIEAGRLRADVVWAANPALFINLKEQGWLTAHDSVHKSAIPAELRDEDDMFFAGRVHHMGIGYNTRLVQPDQVPKTWDDFLTWGNRSASASPLHSGTNFNLLGAFTQSEELGFEWYERAREAGMQVVRGTGDVTRGVVSGEFAVIKGIDYIIAGQAAQGAPVAFAFPEDGVLALPSPIALTRTAADNDAAKAFLDYILSKEGQQVLVDQHFMPIRTDVTPPAGMPTPDQIHALDIDYDWMAENGKSLRERFSDIY